MSHPEQLGFFRAVAAANTSVVDGAAILEIGSYDVNGNIREIFAGHRSYTGVDLVEGPNVDVVTYGHEFEAEPGSFDLAISGECFEHDQHWQESFTNMATLVRPGGLVAFTCASWGRPEHGTTRSDRTLSPGTQHEGLDYYRNLRESDFLEAGLPLDEWFSSWKFWYLPTSMDLYFAGVRRGDAADKPTAVFPREADVAALREIMPLTHKIARLPLIALKRVLPHDRYQDVIRFYWLPLFRLQQKVTGGSFERHERTAIN
ncbi:methyltransferase domain-containing protein [Aeromicrobium sp. Sec7.5]|uniref:methyltransferase domain-containing protein n=1 Tax=Aeromicrobium sp. Sec7.5 TaxID=3121276 RepID=UPI002FE47428